MRISDWSSDVCSSDLIPLVEQQERPSEDVPIQGQVIPSNVHLQLQTLNWPSGYTGLSSNSARGLPVHQSGKKQWRAGSTDIGQKRLLHIPPIYIVYRRVKQPRSEEHTSELQSLMRT